MSLRRLRVLIQHLPPESATKTALRNAQPAVLDAARAEYRPDLAPWSGVEMLLAAIKDEIRLSRDVAVAAAGGKPKEFKPTPRPGIPPTSTSAGRRPLTDEQRRALDPRLRQQPKES
ncbi:hypothetical protein [Streptomyces chryseus]|uniref:hypothetical protein n=1 Tax=Streptomyces chryseus TaxID=68186 RepID=UPI00142ED425|nr:hypothetical protein [Streptomyces chryseus]GGX26942.1 hypothetical protein GCM10010353_47680 [Streptomyces chryseus]